MIRLYVRPVAVLDASAFDVEDMGFDQAARLHAHGSGAFRVSARRADVPDLEFRRMSIAVAHVVRIAEMPS
jgi:hypothetical protein